MAISKKFWTLAQLITKIEQDLDLEGEVFIQPEELIGYINAGIDEAEAEVHTLYEDYFLSRQPLTLVNGTSEYDMPTNIYADKVRNIIYNNGSRAYEITRIREWKKFIEYSLDLVGGPTDSVEYRYFLINETPGEPKILFTPEVGENGTTVVVWFLRQANRLEIETDKMDIPEAANFVMQHAKVSCYEKEGHPNLAKAMNDLEKERALLQGTLATRVPDNNNELEMDLSFYQEMN